MILFTHVIGNLFNALNCGLNFNMSLAGKVISVKHLTMEEEYFNYFCLFTTDINFEFHPVHTRGIVK